MGSGASLTKAAPFRFSLTSNDQTSRKSTKLTPAMQSEASSKPLQDISLLDTTSFNITPKSPRSPRGLLSTENNAIALIDVNNSCGPPSSPHLLSKPNNSEASSQRDRNCSFDDADECDNILEGTQLYIQKDLEERNIRFDEGETDSFTEMDDANAEMFAVTAMSLGMENDDLLFNLMYFGADDATTADFGSVFNSAMEETVAMHHEHNCPYKLTPASADSLSRLVSHPITSDLSLEDRDCCVCRDVMDVGEVGLRLPLCNHVFHSECIFKWLSLQSWCPVCRADISKGSEENVVFAQQLLLSPRFNSSFSAQQRSEILAKFVNAATGHAVMNVLQSRARGVAGAEVT